MGERKKPVSVVRNGALRIDVNRYGDGRYGFDYKPAHGERIKIRCRQQSKAEGRAKDMLATARAGKIDLRNVDPLEFAEFLRWKQFRTPRVSVPDMTLRFLNSKSNKGLSRKHLDELKGTLDLLAEHFTCPISELTREGVETWLNARGIGPRRWNNQLGSIVAMMRFARRDGALTAELHPVELIQRRKTTNKKETYTPEELVAMLLPASEEDRIRLILSGLCGVRPEEVRPDYRSAKTPLDWRNFDWRRNIIDMQPETSKVGERRFIPICEAALSFLKPHRKTSGEIIPISMSQGFVPRVTAASKVAWRPDALRHSYASYRLALIRDMEALALEMGNSRKMIRDHYLDLKHADEAERWFAVRPENLEHFGTLFPQNHAEAA